MPRFCKRLLESPEDAAGEFFAVLDQQDLATLRLVEEDLSALAADSKLHPADARHWALGLLLSLERWAVDGKGIKRNPGKTGPCQEEGPSQAAWQEDQAEPGQAHSQGYSQEPLIIPERDRWRLARADSPGSRLRNVRASMPVQIHTTPV